MIQPLVTIGVPAYNGAEFLPRTLEQIQQQTYRELDVFIAVDSNDTASAEACAPFLDDPRFRIVVHTERHGWSGNVAYLMRNRRGAYFAYQQQDDGMTPDYIEALVTEAEAHPSAAICYAQMHVTTPTSTVMVRHKSLLGGPFSRAITHVERMETSMYRGLIRGSALDAVRPQYAGAHESFGADLDLLAEIALEGEFRLVDGPTYYKLVHAAGTHLKWYNWTEEEKRAAWAAMGARMLDRLVPRGRTHEHRWHLALSVIDRFISPRGGNRWFFCSVEDEDADARGALTRAMLSQADAGRIERALGADAAGVARQISDYFALDLN